MILSFLVYTRTCRYIGKISQAPSGHVLLTNQDGLNDLGRESQRKHFSRYIEICPVVSDKKILLKFSM